MTRALVLVVLTLSGCDDRKCLKSHNDLRPNPCGMMLFQGGQATCLPTTNVLYVCDQYETRQDAG